MESGVPHQFWSIQIHCDVFWVDQFSKYISESDEQHFPQPYPQGKSPSLPQLYPHLHQNPWRTLSDHLSHTANPTLSPPLSQTWEMHIWVDPNWISQPDYFPGWDLHGSSEIQGVSQWLVPTCKHDLQSFLKFINFYQHFIRGFRNTVLPNPLPLSLDLCMDLGRRATMHLQHTQNGCYSGSKECPNVCMFFTKVNNL